MGNSVFTGYKVVLSTTISERQSNFSSKTKGSFYKNNLYVPLSSLNTIQCHTMTICPKTRENIIILANTIGVIQAHKGYNECKGSLRNHLGKTFTSTSHHLHSSSRNKTEVLHGGYLRLVNPLLRSSCGCFFSPSNLK